MGGQSGFSFTEETLYVSQPKSERNGEGAERAVQGFQSESRCLARINNGV